MGSEQEHVDLIRGRVMSLNWTVWSGTMGQQREDGEKKESLSQLVPHGSASMKKRSLFLYQVHVSSGYFYPDVVDGSNQSAD